MGVVLTMDDYKTIIKNGQWLSLDDGHWHLTYSSITLGTLWCSLFNLNEITYFIIRYRYTHLKYSLIIVFVFNNFITYIKKKQNCNLNKASLTEKLLRIFPDGFLSDHYHRHTTNTLSSWYRGEELNVRPSV